MSKPWLKSTPRLKSKLKPSPSLPLKTARKSKLKPRSKLKLKPQSKPNLPKQHRKKLSPMHLQPRPKPSPLRLKQSLPKPRKNLSRPRKKIKKTKNVRKKTRKRTTSSWISPRISAKILRTFQDFQSARISRTKSRKNTLLNSKMRTMKIRTRAPNGITSLQKARKSPLCRFPKLPMKTSVRRTMMIILIPDTRNPHARQTSQARSIRR